MSPLHSPGHGTQDPETLAIAGDILSDYISQAFLGIVLPDKMRRPRGSRQGVQNTYKGKKRDREVSSISPFCGSGSAGVAESGSDRARCTDDAELSGLMLPRVSDGVASSGPVTLLPPFIRACADIQNRS